MALHEHGYGLIKTEFGGVRPDAGSACHVIGRDRATAATLYTPGR